MGAEKAVAERYRVLRKLMDERVTRCWAGAEAFALGRGGVTAVARATTGLSRMTVRAGRDEVSGKSPSGERGRVRRKGAGRPPVEVAQPGLTEALESLVDPGAVAAVATYSNGQPPGDAEGPTHHICTNKNTNPPRLAVLGHRDARTSSRRQG